MKIFLLIFFFSISISAQNQNSLKKYFVYFKDKGITSEMKLQKNDFLFINAEKSLSQRAIQRRKKVLGDEYISYDDIDVYQPYVDSLVIAGAEIIWKLKWFNSVSCYLNDSKLDFISRFSFIKSIEPVKSFKLPKDLDNLAKTSPSSIKSNSKYGESFDEMNLSEIPVAHNLGITGDGILIGVLDAGFNWKNHPALKNTKVVDTYDFVYKDTDLSNDNDYAHGTAVLSLIAGNEYSRLVAPAFDASFILAKTEDIRSEKNIEEDNYAAALEWMEGKGVDITTASLGYNEFDAGQSSYLYSDMDGKTAVCTKALEIAFQKGIVTINSAGNEGNNSWHYITAPSDGFNVLTVGAVNQFNQIASFSSRGPTFDGRIKPEICAMGVNNFVADGYNSDYKYGSGTSYATPIVAGMAAQLLSVFPHLTNKQVRQILIESGDNSTAPNNDIGYGTLSIKRALTFPNISSSGTKLNKIFIPDTIAFDGEVRVFYKANSEMDFHQAAMQYNNLVYNFEFPAYSFGDTLTFYFEYFYNGLKNREPDTKNYKFIYGTNEIHLATKIEESEPLPQHYFLSQNYPNPFNPSTKINYSLPKSDFVTLKVFDILGREVATLVNEQKSAGNYNVEFNVNNLSSGIYFYNLMTGSYSETRKMILLK